MSNEGNNVREVGQETRNDISIFPQSSETDNFVLEDAVFNYFHSSSSSDLSPLHHQQQQQGASAGPVSQIVPSFGGESEKSFQAPISRPELSSFQDLQHLNYPLHYQQQQQGASTEPASQIVPSFGGESEKSSQVPFSRPEFSSFQDLQHLDQSRNVVERVRNFEELFDDALPPPQGTFTGIGSCSYHLPVSKSASEQIFQPSQTVQPPSMQQGYSNNPNVAATSASSPSFPRKKTQKPVAENHNSKLTKSAKGKMVAKDKSQTHLLRSFYPLAIPVNTLNQVPNIEQQRFLGTNPTPNNLIIGGASSSSRNAMVDNPPTMLNNTQQMSAIQVANNPPNNGTKWAPLRIREPLPSQPNHQQLKSNQVDNLPNKGKQLASPRNVKMKMTTPDNAGRTHIANPYTFSNNNQQLASIEVGNNQHYFPGNDQQFTPFGIGNPPFLQNNDQQFAPTQFGSFQNLPTQGNENPHPPPRALQNPFYDPIYEQLGFPVDLTLRMYEASKRNRGSDS